MKQILRIFGVVSVILLAALITAFSCNNDDKSAGGSGSGGSGGSGGGGGGGGINRATIPWDCSGATSYTGPIKVTKAPGASYGSVDIKTDIDNCIYVTIEGGSHGWGAFATNNEDDFNTGIRRYFYGTTELLSRDFIKIEYTGVTGGLVVVVDGTWDPTKLTIPFTGNPPGYGIKEGVHINTVNSTTDNKNYINEHRAHNRSVRKEGLNIFSAFIDENLYFPRISFPAVTPTGTPNPKHNVVDGKPLPAPLNNIPDLQPRIFCHTLVPNITQIPDKADLSDFAGATITQLMGWNLTGGQNSTTCRASSASTPYVEGWGPERIRAGYYDGTKTPFFRVENVPAMAWMQAAKQTDLNAWATAAKAQNKNEIRLRIVAVKTENLKVEDILPGTDNTNKLATLLGGVTPANQASIRDNILARFKRDTGNDALTFKDISESVGLVIRIKTP